MAKQKPHTRTRVKNTKRARKIKGKSLMRVKIPKGRRR